MTKSEQKVASLYKLCKDVPQNECYMNSENGAYCHNCMYCRTYDSSFHYFENRYCSAAPLKKEVS